MSASDDSTPILSEDYDPENDYPVTTRIVRLVAIASDRDPRNLRPLGEVVDTDALDALIDSRIFGDHDVSIELSLLYEGYRV